MKTHESHGECNTQISNTRAPLSHTQTSHIDMAAIGENTLSRYDHYARRHGLRPRDVNGRLDASENWYEFLFEEYNNEIGYTLWEDYKDKCFDEGRDPFEPSVVSSDSEVVSPEVMRDIERVVHYVLARRAPRTTRETIVISDTEDDEEDDEEDEEPTTKRLKYDPFFHRDCELCSDQSPTQVSKQCTNCIFCKFPMCSSCECTCPRSIRSLRGDYMISL